VVFNKDNQKKLFSTTKSHGIQLRFVPTCKMSIGIQKFADFNIFFCRVDFVRLFS